MDSNTSSEMTQYVKRLKLAVALALIRSRPPGMSGEQYAQQVCARYQRQQAGWKEEAERLRKELGVVLSQKSALEVVGQQLVPTEFRPISSEALPSEPVVHPSSMRTKLSSDKADLVMRHVCFLRDILTLGSIARSNPRSRLRPAVLSTVESVLESVRARRSAKVMSNGVAQHVLSIVCQVAGCGDNDISQAVCDKVGISVQRIVGDILGNPHLNAHAEQQELCDCIITLSNSDFLRLRILSILLDSVADFGSKLRRMLNNSSDQLPDPSQLENIAYVLQCMEQILSRTVESRTGVATIGCFPADEDFCRKLSEQLESSLMYLADIFPLFARYIWQLGGLLDALRSEPVATAADKIASNYSSSS